MTVCLFCWRTLDLYSRDRVACSRCKQAHPTNMTRAQLAALALELYWRTK